MLTAGLACALLTSCGYGSAESDVPNIDTSSATESSVPGLGAAPDHYGDGAWREPDADVSDGPGSTPSVYEFKPDPARVPKTAARAEQLVGNAQLEPADWSAGMVRHDPYERDGTWPVLGGDCVWSRVGLPDHVLHTSTRNIDLPAENGRGLLRAAVTVSVHRSVRDAEREIKDTVQESARCPDQDLGGGQRLTGLSSLRFDEQDVRNAEASLFEAGRYRDGSSAGDQDYVWTKSRIGPVTAAISLKGADGHESGDLIRLASEGLARVLYRVELELK